VPLCLQSSKSITERSFGQKFLGEQQDLDGIEYMH
jgi:hypothetical protein